MHVKDQFTSESAAKKGILAGALLALIEIAGGFFQAVWGFSRAHLIP